MQLKRTQFALRTFAKNVIKQARTNLTKSKPNKNVSKTLYNSLKFNLEVDNDDFELTFDLGKYGAYVDTGVKGSDPSLVDSDKRTGKQKAPNSPFKFRSKKPPAKALEAWAKARRFRLRDEKGQFAKGNYKSIGFVLQKFVFAQGIKPSLFFTKPFIKNFENLPKPLLDAFENDIDNFLGFKVKPNE
jgi:hypothetical protein